MGRGTTDGRRRRTTTDDDDRRRRTTTTYDDDGRRRTTTTDDDGRRRPTTTDDDGRRRRTTTDDDGRRQRRALGGLGGIRRALTNSSPRPNIPPPAFPAPNCPLSLKFNCRAPLEALEASEELSQPHPLAPMYPLRNFRPQMAPFVKNSISAPPSRPWKPRRPPRSSHNLIPSPQYTPFGIPGPKLPLLCKIQLPRPFGGLGGLRAPASSSPSSSSSSSSPSPFSSSSFT